MKFKKKKIGMWRERFLIVQIYYARLKPEGCAVSVLSVKYVSLFFSPAYMADLFMDWPHAYH